MYAVVDSRAAQGPFFDNANLGRVRGIRPRTLERIDPYPRRRGRWAIADDCPLLRRRLAV